MKRRCSDSVVVIVKKLADEDSAMCLRIKPVSSRKEVWRYHLNNAFKYVKKNRGSPGVDQVSIEDFERNKDKELCQLIKDLSNWSYKPKYKQLTGEI